MAEMFNFALPIPKCELVVRPNLNPKAARKPQSRRAHESPMIPITHTARHSLTSEQRKPLTTRNHVEVDRVEFLNIQFIHTGQKRENVFRFHVTFVRLIFQDWNFASL